MKGLMSFVISRLEMAGDDEAEVMLLLLTPAGCIGESRGSSGSESTFTCERAMSSGCLVARCDSSADFALNSARQNGQRLWMIC